MTQLLDKPRVAKPPVTVDEAAGYRRPDPPGRRFPSMWILATLLGDVVVSLYLWLFLGWDPLNAVGVSTLSATAFVVVFWAALNRRDRTWLRWAGVWFLLTGIAQVIAYLVERESHTSWGADTKNIVGASSALALIILVAAAINRPGFGWMRWIGVVTALAIIGGGLSVLVEREALTSEAERAALQKLEASAVDFASASGVPKRGSPHLRGLVVPVDVAKATVNEDVYIRLPSEIQARDASEVSTVVLIEYGEKVVGQYEGGDDALREFADLTIVDLVSGKQYDGKRIFGPAPPFTRVKPGVGTGGDESGGPPDPDRIVKYLNSLDRRPVE